MPPRSSLHRASDTSAEIWLIAPTAEGYGHWVDDPGYLECDVPLKQAVADVVLREFPLLEKLAEQMGILPPIVFFAGAAAGDCVGRYMSGSMDEPVLLLNVDFDWESRFDMREELVITLVHEMAHAYADFLGVHEDLAGLDDGGEDLIEEFARGYAANPSRRLVTNLSRDLQRRVGAPRPRSRR